MIAASKLWQHSMQNLAGIVIINPSTASLKHVFEFTFKYEFSLSTSAVTRSAFFLSRVSTAEKRPPFITDSIIQISLNIFAVI